MIERADPHIGLLHRGTEKLIEHKTYVSPMSQEHAYSLCVEKLLQCEVPIRAKYLRVLFCELTRILNHLLNISSQALDVGAMTPLLWLFEEREKILAAYIRPGGLAADIPEGLIEDIAKFIEQFPKYIDDVDDLLTENRIWKQRTVGISEISIKHALDWGFSGPMPRVAGLAKKPAI